MDIRIKISLWTRLEPTCRQRCEYCPGCFLIWKYFPDIINPILREFMVPSNLLFCPQQLKIVVFFVLGGGAKRQNVGCKVVYRHVWLSRFFSLSLSLSFFLFVRVILLDACPRPNSSHTAGRCDPTVSVARGQRGWSRQLCCCTSQAHLGGLLGTRGSK